LAVPGKGERFHRTDTQLRRARGDGEYLVFADSDNVSTPQMLERLVRAWKSPAWIAWLSQSGIQQ